MPYGLYISAEGAEMQAARMEVISNNLANVNTPGFKRDLAMFQARYAEAIEQGLEQEGTGSLDDLGGGVMLAGIETDYSPAGLQTTGQPTDMAIVGDGFFQVRRGNQTYLTRAGNFLFDGAGQLVTQEGDPVLSDSGTPIVVDPDLGPWQLTANGGIQQEGTTTLLALVRPQSLGDLVKVGGNLFMPLAQTAPVPEADRSVQGGYLELSGVNPTSSMMELIETSRAFEANMKLIQNQDNMIGSLISRVLQV